MTSKGTQLTPQELLKNLTASKTTKFGDASKFDVSFDEIDSFGDQASLLNIVGNIKSYNQMLDERITLINDSLTSAIPFTRENLYLFCAFTGSGKSTVAANISYPLWKQGKKTLVISNEETQADVLFRIGCLELGLNFNDYKKGQMPIEVQKKVIALFPEISKSVKVLDVNYKGGLMTKIEGIKNALESVKGQPYSCAMIDYYQLIQNSAMDPSKTRYDVLNDLRIWLGQYIKQSNIPVVMFVQLYSLGKKGGAKEIDARIKECTAIVEPATVIIEVVPNWDIGSSDFIIHKDRFGLAGHKISCLFEKGRYIKMTPDELARREREAKHSKAAKALDNMIQKVDGDDEG